MLLICFFEPRPEFPGSILHSLIIHISTASPVIFLLFATSMEFCACTTDGGRVTAPPPPYKPFSGILVGVFHTGWSLNQANIEFPDYVGWDTR
jgi:hypothetical protein